MLEENGVDLGGNYPEPCVDHSEEEPVHLQLWPLLNSIIFPFNRHTENSSIIMSTAILWFRKCLRLHDNPALS